MRNWCRQKCFLIVLNLKNKIKIIQGSDFKEVKKRHDNKFKNSFLCHDTFLIVIMSGA